MSARPWRSWAGYAAGAVMFGLGVKEALRVGRGSIDDARTSARHVGTARIAAGALMLARPLVLPKMLGLDTGVPRCDGCLACSRSEKLRSVSRPSRRRAEPRTRSRGCACSAPLTGPRRSSCSRVLLSVRSPTRGWPFIASDLGSALAGVGAAAQLGRRRANTSTAGTS